MKRIILYFFAVIFFCVSCNSKTSLSERDTFIQKIEAFQFLSEYHHQLHIMIGEDEGDGNKAFLEFSNALKNLDNPELVAVLAHEIGHYKKRHIIQGMVVSIIHTGVIFFLLSIFLESQGLFDSIFISAISVNSSIPIIRAS